MARRRAATATAVVLFHAAVLYVLASRSSIQLAPPVEALKLFDVHEVPPDPPEEKRPEVRPARPEGAASRANLRARPKPVVAPPPVVRVEVPPPAVAPPVAAQGPDASAGGADVRGPGTGSGGEGSGLGSGSAGSGTGGGGAPARWMSGRIRDSDYPRSASRAEIGGTVIVHFDVGTDGRVSNCRVVGSSGNAALDETTCRLIESRFRYEPARNSRGEPVPDIAGWKQDWWLESRR